jgi:hypothetical protein
VGGEENRVEKRPNVLHQNLIEFRGQGCGSTLREHGAVSRVSLEEDLEGSQ